MVAEINITLAGQDSVFIIPKSAVVNAPERVFVIRVRDGKAQLVTVKKGREVNDRMEIYGDLVIGDVLLQSASEEIREGTVVGK